MASPPWSKLPLKRLQIINSFALGCVLWLWKYRFAIIKLDT